jgi:ABC-type branched-subunit amino acid transport system ATPase component
MTTASCLRLDRVSRHFGGLKAVDNVTLDVRMGARHALIGPNGAGKTTLFNVISGETSATTGTIRFLDADVTKEPPHARAARGMARTFQIIRLFPSLTVRENMLMACQALDPVKYAMLRPLSSCRPLTARTDALLDEFGLANLRHAAARHLSTAINANSKWRSPWPDAHGSCCSTSRWQVSRAASARRCSASCPGWIRPWRSSSSSTTWTWRSGSPTPSPC